MEAGSKIRIYELAKEFRADAKQLIEDLRREGIDVRIPSNTISRGLAEKIRHRYAPKKNVDPKRPAKRLKKKARADEETTNELDYDSLVKVIVGRLRDQSPELWTPEAELIELHSYSPGLKAIMLQRRADAEQGLLRKARSQADSFVRKRLVKAACRTGVDLRGAKKLNWKLRPPGKHPFQQIVKHFENLSKSRHGVQADLDEGRLRKLRALGPDSDRIYTGEGEFEKYIVFCFSRAATVVLECPVLGNATYVFDERDWKSLSRLSKYHLLRHHYPKIVRIVHNGQWFTRLKSEVATRGLRVSLCREGSLATGK